MRHLDLSDTDYAGTLTRTPTPYIGGTRKPRTRALSLTSDCVVTHADGSHTIIPKAKPRTHTRKPKIRDYTSNLTMRDIALQARMGTIHADGA